MPPRRAHKYVVSQSSRRKNRGSGLKKDTPLASVFVEWNLPTEIEVSARQWVLLTSALCVKGALSPNAAPGDVHFEIPKLTITVSSIEIFEKFRRESILIPLQAQYNIEVLDIKPGIVLCTISYRQ